jgi:hypothetical protein
MSTDLSVEKIDEAIEKAMPFSSMMTDGDSVVNQSLYALMAARKELKAEEDINSGKRRTFSTFDLSEQSF